MLIGAAVGIGAFYWTDKIFKNDGMFVTAFIASTDSIYIVAIALSLTIKNRDVLTAMAIFIGVIQIFGTLFSYTFYFMNKVYDWEIMYIPLLNVHYEYNGIYLILPIILLTTSFYWIQKERK